MSPFDPTRTFGTTYLVKYRGTRDTLRKWAEKKGLEGVHEFWEKRNQVSIDGKPSHIFSDAD